MRRRRSSTCSRAGDQARLAYAHQEAFDYYERALTILESQGDHDRTARMLMSLGLAYHDAFQFEAARQTFDKATQLWLQTQQEPPASKPVQAPHALRLIDLSLRTLDPSSANDITSCDVIDHLFSGLIGYGRDWSLVPELSQTWQVLDDGLTYEFQLRDGVMWSDGTPLTSADFTYAFQRLLEPTTSDRFSGVPLEIRGARAYHEREITDFDRVGVEAPDPLTLRIQLTQPVSYFLHLLAQVYPIPRHVVAKVGEDWTKPKHMVSNGPFRLESWEVDQQIVLGRNPCYHGRFPGNINELVLRFNNDVSTWLQIYEADEIDVVSLYSNMMGKAVFERALQRHSSAHRRKVDMSTIGIAFNATHPPFDDVRVRRAFGFAGDWDAVSNTFFCGEFLPATGGFIPPGMPGHSSDIGLPYDPERACQLMAEAGYPDGRGFPELVALVPIAGLGIAEAIGDMWRNVLQVEITWRGLDFDELYDRDQKRPGTIVVLW